MFERNLILKRLTVKNNFLHINPKLKFLKTGTCVRLSDSFNNVYYFSVGDHTIELDENCVGISSSLANALGIGDDILFNVSEITVLPSVQNLTIFPINSSDYEVLNMLSDTVQEILLNQIRVVSNGQKFVIYIGNNINVTVTVGNINPTSPGAIDFLTEAHIEPLSNNIETKNITKSKDSLTHIKQWNFFANSNDDAIKNCLQHHLKSNRNLIFRIIPIDKIPIDITFRKSLPEYCIFLSKKQFSEEFIETFAHNRIFRLALLTNDAASKDLYVKLEFLEDFIDTDITLKQELYVGQEIFEHFECLMGARIILTSIDSHPPVTQVQIFSKKNYINDTVETFKQFLAHHSERTFVLNENIPIDIGHDIICYLKFIPDDPKYCVVNDNLVRNCKYILNIENITKKSTKNDKITNIDVIENISNFLHITNITKDILSQVDSVENVLISGRSGMGKSTILKKIANEIENYPHFIYIKYLNCKNIKGKTMDSLNKLFSTYFSELLLHMPSVIILDDLHVLCENSQGDETTPNNIYFNRVSEMLHNILKSFSAFKIGILASTQSIDKLNKNIYSSRGSYLFKNVYSINNLSKIDRIAALKFLFRDVNTKQVNFGELSIKTEGFVMQDLVRFVNRAIFELYKNEPDEKLLIIKPEYIDNSLKNTTAISLHNVQLHTSGERDFSHIGGMQHIKKIIMESLLWPGQYPNIFANAPLRLQTGLLLYGPPGCGKTILAAAAAKQCGLRLISVKGPELLSKYIGASEQAVRDIFQKAQSAKPCILFFDEFDSLAPKRGHDNTGVTDRVVNQLLTQLDGVESLTGVCVLAATSRPDLLDYALLRPGRLDKQILCPWPNETDRLDILRVLSQNLTLDADVSFDNIAAKTENFSGADLQSLLYTAYMLSIDNYGNEEVSSEKTKISNNNLEEALNKTKPSLNSKNRAKYEWIYSKFQRGSTVEDLTTGSRATFA